MAEAIGRMLLGLVIGALFVRAVEDRHRRRVAHLVELLAPYHRVGTSAPSNVTVAATAGLRRG